MNSHNQDNNSSLERKQPSEDVSSELVPADEQNNSDSDDLPELVLADYNITRDYDSVENKIIYVDLPEHVPADEQNNSDSDDLHEHVPADEQNNSDSDDLPEHVPADEQNNSDSDDLPELVPADEQNNSDSDDLPELVPADEQNNSDSDDLPELVPDDRFYYNDDDRIYNYFRSNDRFYYNDNRNYRSNVDELMNFLSSITLPMSLITLPNFNNIEQNQIMNSENNESKCTFCNSYYDHHNNSQYFMSCCAKDYCLKCVTNFKEKEKKDCPSCNYSLDYLKDVELPKFDDVIPEEGEDCMICCYSMGTTQYNGKVTLECNCNLELCITCAYKSLKDAKHIEMENVQGLNGIVLPQEYIIKGSCPHCRQIPKNKDDIIALYNFLPPRY